MSWLVFMALAQAPDVAPAPAPEDFVPPTLKDGGTVPLPKDAPLLSETVNVTVRLRVDATGHVVETELLSGVGEPFDSAVLEGTKSFVFEPGRYQGQPVEVDITFTQEFAADARALLSAPERVKSAKLFGTLIERGTKRVVPLANIIVMRGGKESRVESDKDGKFSMSVVPGECAVEVRAPGYKRFLVSETLADNERVEVRYLLERLSYDPYETIVVTRRERTEIARTSLRNREIKQVPGTFGDPFRVVGTLPGVGQVFSLLNYPLVRGTSPGNTGFLLDGVAVPQLFHLFAGPSVIHPEFIDRVDFYPGVFPQQYGGYTGGIVDGVTRRGAPDEKLLEINVDLLNAGLFVRQPVEALGATVSAAGRYGYPGLLLSALNTGLTLSYWDYQLRLDGGQDNRWTAFAFGSYDDVGTQTVGQDPRTLARSMFHRLDLRYNFNHDDDRRETMSVVFGVDQILSNTAEESGDDQVDATITSWSVNPRFEHTRRLFKSMRLRAGVEGKAQAFRGGGAIEGADPQSAQSLGVDTEPELYNGGVYVDFPWQLTSDLTVTPGVRSDIYYNTDTTQLGVDPRLLARYRVTTLENGDVVLKAGAGSFFSPPRLPVPLPAMEALGLSRGLAHSWQGSMGIELPVFAGLDLDATGYFSYMDRIYYDLAYNDVELPSSSPLPLPGSEPIVTGEAPAHIEDDPSRVPGIDLSGATSFLNAQRQGRSFGLEVLLKKRDEGNVFGWISYTLSRSERLYQQDWVVFDFDRTHMLHVVAGYKLPRNWNVGGRFQVQSGRPITDASGYNNQRMGAFFRADLRIDKTAVYNDWLLDFYIDVINVSLAPERLDQSPNSSFRYVLPTVGFRGRL